VTRKITGDSVVPGEDYIVWFALKGDRETLGAVAINIVPRGYYEANGWLEPPFDKEFQDKPVLRRLRFLVHGENVVDLAMSSDGKRVASVDEKDAVKIWDVEGERVIASCFGRMAEFSPAGDLLVTAATSADSTSVILWDAKTGERLRTPSGSHFLHVSALAFSPDGRYLATGGIRKPVWKPGQRARMCLRSPVRRTRTECQTRITSTQGS
jgi:dipeptidyl aminopeptidase/acylaminoacyl peptidase